MPTVNEPTPEKKRAILILAAQLGELRGKARLSQQELAKAAGLGRDSVHRIEQAKTDPKLSAIEAVADALGTTPSDLLK